LEGEKGWEDEEEREREREHNLQQLAKHVHEADVKRNQHSRHLPPLEREDPGLVGEDDRGRQTWGRPLTQMSGRSSVVDPPSSSQETVTAHSGHAYEQPGLGPDIDDVDEIEDGDGRVMGYNPRDTLRGSPRGTVEEGRGSGDSTLSRGSQMQDDNDVNMKDVNKEDQLIGLLDETRKQNAKKRESMPKKTPPPPPAAAPAAPPPTGGDGGAQRRVHFNDKRQNEEEAAKVKQTKGDMVTGNAVTTSKYTFYTLLPLNLTEQFSKLANVYFLVISLLQLFTNLSPTSKFSTAGPLTLVLMANLVREMWEDSKRHADDATVNNSTADVVCDGGKIEQRAWKNIEVGDILRVTKGQPLPADVVQLASSEEQGNSYIDTCDLDGETNLKIKSSLSLTVHATTASSVSALRGHMEYEAPNKRLYTFLGKLTIKGQTVAVDNDVVLLRGAVLRNTPWIFALVVYAGKQTKVMMNSQAAKAKRSNVDRASNVILLAVLAFMLVVCTVGCVGHAVWMSDPVNSVGIWCALAPPAPLRHVAHARPDAGRVGSLSAECACCL